MKLSRSKLPGTNQRGNNIYKLLTSPKLTIFLLAFIAITSIFGTVIKQKADIEEYPSVYSESTYRIIRFFSLDDVYHSPWFLAAIALFAVNLGLCTFGRYKHFQKTQKNPINLPGEQVLSTMPMHFSVKATSAGHGINLLKKHYKIIHEEENGAVLEKGIAARYGALIIHLSILIILAGSLIGLVFGYKGFVVLNKGETKSTITVRGSKKEVYPGFAIRCKDFRVSFYPGGQPKDYVSSLEVIENNKVITEKDIRVNDPLNYKGIYVYQSSYGAVPYFIFNIDGEEVALKERDTYEKDGLILMVVRFENAVHDFGPGVLVAYLDQEETKTVWFLKNVERMKERDIQGVNIRLEDIKEDLYTGLEVSSDPGIWVVWTGFASILFGLYINFFIYYRKVYIRKTSDGIIVAGHAFRNQEAFREEFEKLKKEFSANEP
ncbi:MAG: cytochrome c biogenesis protein ResB [Proteobacteria bacterium]|nr:cytochrome c biogenesis protein ResB [Pseudomonadota bacterium]